MTPRQPSSSNERQNYAYVRHKELKPHLITSPRQYTISPRPQSSRSSLQQGISTNANSVYQQPKPKSKIIKVNAKENRQQGPHQAPTVAPPQQQ